MTICGHCGASATVGAWRELELVDQLSEGRVSALVTHWPDGAAIEVRRCGRCGSPLARKVSSPAVEARP